MTQEIQTVNNKMINTPNDQQQKKSCLLLIRVKQYHNDIFYSTDWQKLLRECIQCRQECGAKRAHILQDGDINWHNQL